MTQALLPLVEILSVRTGDSVHVHPDETGSDTSPKMIMGIVVKVENQGNWMRGRQEQKITLSHCHV